MDKVYDFLNINIDLASCKNLFQNQKIMFSSNIVIYEKNKEINLSIAITSNYIILFDKKEEVFRSKIDLITNINFNSDENKIYILFEKEIKVTINCFKFNKILIKLLFQLNKSITLFYLNKKIAIEEFFSLLKKSERSININNSNSTNDSNINDSDYDINDFELKKIIGIGGFSQVVLANSLYNNKNYAIKILKKIDIIKKKQIKNILTEKNILEKLKNNFITKLNFNFNTFSKWYFVMDYFENGNLLELLTKKNYFDEESAKFYIASIALGLNYFHKKNYIYRDLKLENILIDKDGFLKLTDFGISKYISKRQKEYEITGTPEYMAPEIIKSTGYNFEIDYWSLGIISFELVNGFLPFFEKQVSKTYIKILRETPKFDENIILSKECKNFISSLLNKNPKERLGSKNGIKEIMEHKFFKNFDWEALNKNKIIPPFKPNLKTKINLGKYQECEIDNISFEEINLLKKYEKIL